MGAVGAVGAAARAAGLLESTLAMIENKPQPRHKMMQSPTRGLCTSICLRQRAAWMSCSKSQSILREYHS